MDKLAPILEDMRNYSYSGDHPDQPWSFPLRVSQKAVEVIYLGASTRKYDGQWTAALHFVADGIEWTTDNDNLGAIEFYDALGVRPRTSKIFYRVEL